MPVTSRLGWRTQFAWARYEAWVQASRRVRVLERRPLPPLGHFWLIRLARLDDSAGVRSDDAAGVRVGVAAHVRADDGAKIRADDASPAVPAATPARARDTRKEQP